MTREECFEKAKLIISIAKAFNEGDLKDHFDYYEDNKEHCLKIENGSTVIVYDEDYSDDTEYNSDLNYIGHNPDCVLIKTDRDKYGTSFSTEDFPLQWDDETVFQYSTIYSERILDAMMIMWYIRKNYNRIFYIDMDYMFLYQRLI